MHARLNGGRAALTAFLLVTASAVLTSTGAPAAQAASGGGSCQSGGSGGTSGGGGGGSINGGTVTMWSMLTVHAQQSLCPSGATGGGGGNYTPPQCWWGPEYSPQELGDDIGQLDTNGGSAIDTYMALNEEYAHDGTKPTLPANYKSTDGPPWEFYNIGAKPDGEWWGLIWNDAITMQGIQDCTAIDTKHFPEDWYWVSTGGNDPAPGDAPVFNAYELALYVQGKVKLNPLPIQTSPDVNVTKATVGLPTWVWANAANATITDQFCTQQQYGGICVGMTATAQSFTIATDDTGATVYSDCKIDPSGTVGVKYTGQSGTPPCGVTFSQPGKWTLTLQTTWNVKITYAGGSLTGIGYSETDLAATVQEVQAINN